jgi:prevent-host-death family protein
MNVVGIRELKANLSACLRRVRNGETLIVTDRGSEIATIVPVKSRTDTSWAWAMVQQGAATWNGQKPRGANDRVGLRGEATVSEAVIEDRG